MARRSARLEVQRARLRDIIAGGERIQRSVRSRAIRSRIADGDWQLRHAGEGDGEGGLAIRSRALDAGGVRDRDRRGRVVIEDRAGAHGRFAVEGRIRHIAQRHRESLVALESRIAEHLDREGGIVLAGGDRDLIHHGRNVIVCRIRGHAHRHALRGAIVRSEFHLHVLARFRGERQLEDHVLRAGVALGEDRAIPDADRRNRVVVGDGAGGDARTHRVVHHRLRRTRQRDGECLIRLMDRIADDRDRDRGLGLPRWDGNGARLRREISAPSRRAGRSGVGDGDIVTGGPRDRDDEVEVRRASVAFRDRVGARDLHLQIVVEDLALPGAVGDDERLQRGQLHRRLSDVHGEDLIGLVIPVSRDGHDDLGAALALQDRHHAIRLPGVIRALRRGPRGRVVFHHHILPRRLGERDGEDRVRLAVRTFQHACIAHAHRRRGVERHALAVGIHDRARAGDRGENIARCILEENTLRRRASRPCVREFDGELLIDLARQIAIHRHGDRLRQRVAYGPDEGGRRDRHEVRPARSRAIVRLVIDQQLPRRRGGKRDGEGRGDRPAIPLRDRRIADREARIVVRDRHRDSPVCVEDRILKIREVEIKTLDRSLDGEIAENLHRDQHRGLARRDRDVAHLRRKIDPGHSIRAPHGGVVEGHVVVRLAGERDLNHRILGPRIPLRYADRVLASGIGDEHTEVVIDDRALPHLVRSVDGHRARTIHAHQFHREILRALIHRVPGHRDGDEPRYLTRQDDDRAIHHLREIHSVRSSGTGADDSPVMHRGIRRDVMGKIDGKGERRGRVFVPHRVADAHQRIVIQDFSRRLVIRQHRALPIGKSDTELLVDLSRGVPLHIDGDVLRPVGEEGQIAALQHVIARLPRRPIRRRVMHRHRWRKSERLRERDRECRRRRASGPLDHHRVGDAQLRVIIDRPRPRVFARFKSRPRRIGERHEKVLIRLRREVAEDRHRDRLRERPARREGQHPSRERVVAIEQRRRPIARGEIHRHIRRHRLRESDGEIEVLHPRIPLRNGDRADGESGRGDPRLERFDEEVFHKEGTAGGKGA